MVATTAALTPLPARGLQSILLLVLLLLDLVTRGLAALTVLAVDHNARALDARRPHGLVLVPGPDLSPPCS